MPADAFSSCCVWLYLETTRVKIILCTNRCTSLYSFIQFVQIFFSEIQHACKLAGSSPIVFAIHLEHKCLPAQMKVDKSAE